MNNINKYQYGVIYKITNTEEPDMLYVGSTTYDLDVSMIKHRSDAKNRPNLSSFYTYMNETGIDKFEIEEVAKYPCESKEELRKREGEIIREIGTLNKRIEGRTQQEYSKEYKQMNKDKINERRRERRRENPEKTKEERRRDGKIFRERHKEELKTKASVKFDCECGGKFTEGHRHEHMNSKNI